MKSNLGKFIRDIIPVLLGVLIALWINNWNEARKDRIYIENFYTSLKKEFTETDQEITDKKPLQKRLVDTLAVYSSNETFPLMKVIEKGGGLNGPLIKLNYWKALSNSKIELLAYDKLTILADIEEMNEVLKYKRNKLLDFTYANLSETGSQQKLLMRMMMIEMLKTQNAIQGRIQQILDE